MTLVTLAAISTKAGGEVIAERADVLLARVDRQDVTEGAEQVGHRDRPFRDAAAVGRGPVVHGSVLRLSVALRLTASLSDQTDASRAKKTQGIKARPAVS
jgi:hypothetical protein